MLRKVKKLILNPHPEPDQHHTSTGSLLVHTMYVYGRRPLTRSWSYSQNEQMTDATIT